MSETDLEFAAGPNAFGDGSHPTTAGCLAALEAIDPTLFSPRISCDMGCGSGLLALSIIRMFKSSVVAADISAQAIETLRENCRKNGIEIFDYTQGHSVTVIKNTPRILPIRADGFAHPAIMACGPYDLITMNILAEPLLRLAVDADAHLAPGGVLITSGILQWQEPQIRDAYQSLGLELVSRLTVKEWVTLVWQKP